ncbi:MAG TPA: TlpA disulfide reductase family protein [Pirellulales bacterium]|nr:TlpA disulfide reductase family protein [Pirellulales bacterium]
MDFRFWILDCRGAFAEAVGWKKRACERRPTNGTTSQQWWAGARKLAGPTLLLALLCSPAVAQRNRADIGVINDVSPGSRGVQQAAPAVEPTPPADAPVAYLQDDDWMTGTPAAGEHSDRFGWQSPGFTQPFELDLHALQRVRFPVASAPAWRDHDYRLELAGGDVLFGELLAVSDENLRFRSSVAGELRVKRPAVRCLERCKANALVYIGPNGLAEWQTPGPDDAWREDEGHLLTEKDAASLYSPIGLPARALVEFELSSLFPPVFRLALGVGGDAASRRKGFRLEVVDLDVIAVYETGNDIDVARVMTLAPGPERDRVHLRVLLDQQEQRAEVFSAEGLPLATVHIDADAPKVSPGILLEHKRGGLRFERLRVWEWSGSLPQPVAANRPQLHRVDGPVINGKLSGYDGQKRQFSMKTEQGDVACPEEQVARICFGEPAAPPDRPMRVSCADGTQLSGWFAGVDGQRLSLDCLSIDTPALDSSSLPLAAVASIAFNYQLDAQDKVVPAAKSSLMVLRLDTARLHGWLAPAKAGTGHSGIAWRPAASAGASPLREGIPGRVTGVTATRRMSRSEDATVRYDRLYLMTGDTFRCRVTGIDDRGVACHTASAEKQIAHDRIKAIDLSELSGRSGTGRPTFEEFARQAVADQERGPLTRQREKLERLLTLPRLNRDDPPTHILCATSGDYLRGRLLNMAGDVVHFAVGQNEREFPRELIAAIVWLHPDPPTADARAAETPSLVHAVCSDGTRMTFTVSETDDRVIAGTSDVLGECRLPLDRLSELLLGERVRQATSKVGYHGWTLTPAPDPKAFQEGGELPAGTGRDSSLVGQPAPDFELDLLDGSKFRLSEHKGRTVVLDFWASWCAPCVQSLPKLSRRVAESKAADVKLVAVNLQQSADDVKASLKRMQLDIVAALDRDGAVAARYGATVIPYTVIIAPDGNVARVFIGAGPENEKGIEAALEEAHAAKEAAQPSKEGN